MPVITSNHHHNSKEGVSMIINTNMGSSTAARILANNTSELQKSLKRLSTGSKVASISDDSAGVAIAGKMSAEIKRISASRSNVSNLISLSQTQEGYLNQISGALNRMSELAMLATDATKSTTDITAYNDEFQELEEFVDAMANKEFNGLSLFSGEAYAAYLGIKSNGTSISWATTGISLAATSNAIGSAALTSTAAASSALDSVQDAIDKLAIQQSDLGSNLSRLESERASLMILRDNLASARSEIMDVNVAEESANFARQQILVQSGTAMLAQANILPQSALRLIG
jgi:flagellin